MKLILEQFGGAFLYVVLGSGICAALFCRFFLGL